MSWIKQLLDATDEAETPRSWVYWSGICTISAIIGPNVWINRKGIYRLSPNLFVMLIGESGLGKGLPIWVSKTLVRMVGSTRVISGRNTIQSILKDLANSETNEKDGIPKWKDSRGYVISGEFSTLLQEDKAALPIITEIYDTHYSEDWENRTKASGKDKLEKPNLTLFGASTPEHFRNVVPEADVRGGFVGRILTIFEERRYRINPLTNTDEEFKFPFDSLVEHLKLLSLLKGPFHWAGKEVIDEWEKWYNDIRARKIHDPTGAVNRLPDNVLKVAMCISMSYQADELVIEKCHLEEAIDKCMSLSIESRRLTQGRGKSALGEGTKLVVETLFKDDDHTMSKAELLRRHYGEFDVFELDRIIATLETAEMIRSHNTDKGVILEMPLKAVNSIKAFMEKRIE